VQLFSAGFRHHFVCFDAHKLHNTLFIGVGDRGQGGRAPSIIRETIFFDDYYVKVGHFGGKNHVEFESLLIFWARIM